MEENEADHDDVDQENDRQGAGNFRAVIIVFEIIIGRCSDALLAAAGDGAQALENALAHRIAFNGKSLMFHGVSENQ